jgi:hypothetical protein
VTHLAVRQCLSVYGLSFGQLGDQGLRTRPGKLQRAAIDDLQQQ